MVKNVGACLPGTSLAPEGARKLETTPNTFMAIPPKAGCALTMACAKAELFLYLAVLNF
jgi:hypothetical protein